MAGTRRISPAKSIGGTVMPGSPVLWVPVKANETFKSGALLLLDANGLAAECGADPSEVSGIALSPAASAYGYGMADSPAVVTGRADKIPMAVANTSTIFMMRAVNGGTDPASFVQSLVNDAGYGALKDGNGIWTLDLAETTAKVFKIIAGDTDPLEDIFYCKFLAAVISGV